MKNEIEINDDCHNNSDNSDGDDDCGSLMNHGPKRKGRQEMGKGNG